MQLHLSSFLLFVFYLMYMNKIYTSDYCSILRNYPFHSFQLLQQKSQIHLLVSNYKYSDNHKRKHQDGQRPNPKVFHLSFNISVSQCHLDKPPSCYTRSLRSLSSRLHWTLGSVRAPLPMRREYHLGQYLFAVLLSVA